MKSKILAILSSAKGRAVSLSVGAVLGLLSRFAAKAGFDLDPELANMIAALVALLVGWLIDALILRVNCLAIRDIQETMNVHPEINVKVDGYAGPATRSAAAILATNAENEAREAWQKKTGQ